MNVRILHCFIDSRLGGPHNYVRNIEKNLGSLYKYEYLTMGDGPITDKQLSNFKSIWRPLYLLDIPINTVMLLFYCRNNGQPLIIHTHGFYNIAPIIVAILYRLPLVWQLHEEVDSGHFNRIYQKIIKKLLLLHKKKRYLVISVSRKVSGTLDIECDHIMPGAIDTNSWNALFDNEKRGSEEIVTLCSVGNINPIKGYDVLLEALDKINRSDIQLYIVGKILRTHRRYYEYLNTLSRKLHLKVNFIGWQERDKVQDILYRSQIYVMPSRSEACPLALLEAMSSGMVCLATNVGDVPIIIESGINGFVCECTADSLRDSIDKIIDLDRREYIRIGIEARRTVKNNYNIDILAKKYTKIYDSIVDL